MKIVQQDDNNAVYEGCVIFTLQIRMSVGLEDTADIIEDLEQALKVKRFTAAV